MQTLLKPLNRHVVLIKLTKEEQDLDLKEKTGLFLPETANQDKIVEKSRVYAKADDCELKFNVGDVVLFSKMIPQDFAFREEDGTQRELFVIKETDIVGILQNKESNG